MTDKQSTVAVSRELLPCPFCGSPDVHEMRYDCSDFIQCHACYASTRADLAMTEAVEAWNKRATSAATPEPEQAVDVGEPVAWVNPSNLARFKGDIGATVYQLSGSQVPLYRHAQPPAKVLLPERRPDDYPSPRTRDCWNACLDEVARLNGIKP